MAQMGTTRHQSHEEDVGAEMQRICTRLRERQPSLVCYWWAGLVRKYVVTSSVRDVQLELLANSSEKYILYTSAQVINNGQPLLTNNINAGTCK